jgi:hypothetical protein
VPRKRTHPTFVSREERIKRKRRVGAVKRLRRRVEEDE